MNRRRPPPYLFFQSAFVDPSLPDRVATGPLPLPLEPQSKQSSIMKITVGTTPDTQRIWHLPTTLLSRHSAYLRTICTDPSTRNLLLPNIAPSTFQNFIDYMYSSIYSLHRHASDYHPILSNIQAWVLGDKLEALAFKTAAMRRLYEEVVPLARDSGSGVLQSPIRAMDVEFVCANTEVGCVLRAMIFDAVVSHWRQSEVLDIRHGMEIDTPYHSPEPPTAFTIWLNVYHSHSDFRARLVSSLKVGDAFRYDMLRPVEDYIKGRVGMREDEVGVVGAERGRKKKRRALLSRRSEDLFGSHRRSSSTRGVRGSSPPERAILDEENEFVMAEEVYGP